MKIALAVGERSVPEIGSQKLQERTLLESAHVAEGVRASVSTQPDTPEHLCRVLSYTSSARNQLFTLA